MKRRNLVLVAASIALLSVALASGFSGFLGNEEANLNLKQVETVNGSCLNNSVGSDTLPESAISRPTSDGREVIVEYVIPVTSKDADVDAELTKTDGSDGKPVYKLDVSTSSSGSPASCDYGILYRAQITVTPESPYTMKIYHNGDFEGKIGRTQSGFVSSSSETAR